MLPKRSFLFRAHFDWIVASDSTPYLVVDVSVKHVQVPEDFIQDNQIVLNISPDAVKDFVIDNRYISFSATFGGQEYAIYVPMLAVVAIYAKETGGGISFEAMDEDADHPLMMPVAQSDLGDGSGGGSGRKGSASHLKIIK